MRTRQLVLLVLAGIIAGLAVSPAHAAVYWGSMAGAGNAGSIGRANLDATDVAQRFIDSPVGDPGASDVGAIAVDGSHIYWLQLDQVGGVTTTTIARADLDGSHVEPDFITPPHQVGVPPPGAIAVDGSHIYWTQPVADSTLYHTNIARAELDGSDVEPDFIDGSPPIAIAQETSLTVGPAGLYFRCGSSALCHTPPDGSTVDTTFIPGLCDPPFAIAVDGSHIYWGSNERPISGVCTASTTIARADLDGSHVELDFMVLTPPSSTRLSVPGAIAVDGSHIYWTHGFSPGPSGSGWRGATIARARLDGSDTDPSFITDCPPGIAPLTLAVDPAGPTGGEPASCPLTVSLAGDGAPGATVSSDPSGISCPPRCHHPFPLDTEVELTARPAPGGLDPTWTGDIPSDRCVDFTVSCTVPMDQGRSVRAWFPGRGAPPGPTCANLRITVPYDGSQPFSLPCSPSPGGGAITFYGLSAPTCPHASGPGCISEFNYGTGRGRYAATAAAGPTTDAFRFRASSGSRSSNLATARVTILGPPPPDTHNLAVSTAGSGTVTSEPAGIDCGRTCSHAYQTGRTVALTATPSTGWKFAGWSGACTGVGEGCTVTMDADRSATATFELVAVEHSLTVTTSGSGSGTVTSEPAGIDCGSTCATVYPAGTRVELTGAPAAGATFGRWEGCTTVHSDGTCAVIVNVDTTVDARFNTPRPNQPPTANAVATLVRHSYDRFRLDGSSSIDPDGTITAYRWTVNGHRIARRKRVVRRFPDRERVALTVVDNTGATDTAHVVVRPRERPPARITLPAVYFHFDRATLRPAAQRVLARVRRVVRDARALHVDGYCRPRPHTADNAGVKARCRYLARERARQVKSALLRPLKASHKPRHVRARGRGISRRFQRPARDRRVVITVLEPRHGLTRKDRP